MRRWVLLALPPVLALVLVAGGFVRWEPSLYEYGMAILIPLTAFVGGLRYRRSMVLPGTLLAAFLVFSGVSLVNSGDLFHSFRYLFITGYLSVTGVYFAGVLCAGGTKIERWLWRGYIVAGLVAAAVGWLGVVGVGPFQSFVWGEMRAVAGFKDPNVYGAFLVPSVLFLLHELRWSRSRGPFLYAVGFGLVSIGQVLSLSRAAWLNLVVSLATYGALSIPTKLEEIKRIVLGIVLAGIWLGPVIALQPMLLSIIVERVKLMEYDQTRFSVQAMLWSSIRSHPWGIGPGEIERTFEYAAHSLYLRVLAENGWLAGFAFFGLLALCVGVAVRATLRYPLAGGRSARAAVAASLVGTLVNSLFIDSMHWRHLWLLLGMCIWLGYAGLDTEEVQK